MELSSEFVGARCRPLEIAITPRRSMNYAASIGDDNPWYFDDERAEGIVAPPMLAIALTWHISERFADYWRDTPFPTELLARQVHYSETLEFARPMIPGETLRIEGECAAILPHPAGTHLIVRYTAFDKDGQEVFREFIGGMLRDVKCVDKGTGAEALPANPRSPLAGASIWQSKVHVDRLAAYVYDGCAEIHFPIHTSPAFAHQVGLPAPIYMGTGTLALAVREITNQEADADPRRIKRIGCNFTGMVLPGSDITVQALRREAQDGGTLVHFNVLDAEGKRALRNGFVLIAP